MCFSRNACIFLRALLLFLGLFSVRLSNAVPEGITIDSNRALSWKNREAIGSGSEGRVYKVPDADGNVFAFKVYNPLDYSMPTEIKLLELIKEQVGDSTFFPKYYSHDVGFFWRNKAGEYKKCWGHSMEYMPCSLHALIDEVNARGTLLDERLVKKIIYFILCGTDVLHNLGYIHRDLKPNNILLSVSANQLLGSESVDFRAVMTDFGLATKTLPGGFLGTNPERPCTPDMVTLDHRPIENCMDASVQHYGEYTDTWSIGIIFLTLLINRNPVWDAYQKISWIFPCWPERQKLSKAISVLDSRYQGKFYNILDSSIAGTDLSPDKEGIQYFLKGRAFSEIGLNVLSRMLVRDTDVRPSPKELLKDCYWDDIDKPDEDWEFVTY